MEIDFTTDCKTGSPCVRLSGLGPFVGLMPITKLQAESWICEGDAVRPEDIAALVRRISLSDGNGRFHSAVYNLRRAPVGALRRETALSACATNLSVWSCQQELENLDIQFPTPESEWGRLLRWIGGRVPTYQDWSHTKQDFSAIRTFDLIDAAANLKRDWAPAIANVLWKLRELADPEDRGLPFMESGLYELIADPEFVQRTLGGFRNEVRPQVAGNSPVWPSLSTTESTRWRAIRAAILPVVGLRPWFSQMQVNAVIATIDLPEILAGSARAGEDRRNTLKPAERTLRPFRDGKDRMDGVCPFCHINAGSAFTQYKSFVCVEHRVEVTEKNGDKRIEKKRDHPHSSDDPRAEHVSSRYVDFAKRAANRIRTVANAGDQRAGKTTWYTSFGGIAGYPDADSRLHRMFPKAWKFDKTLCSLYDLHRGGGTGDPKKDIEAMWLDGQLPARTTVIEKASRELIHLEAKPGWRKQELILILDDSAGELITRPKLLNAENYPHFASAVDVLWIMPADELSIGLSKGFAERLKDGLNLKGVNLIFAISKIDQLKFGIPEQRDLLQRILPGTYHLPDCRDEAEMKRYLEDMVGVHYGIVDWLDRYKPEFFGFFDQFASYRCCGFSAFGFAPMSEKRALYDEASLPFRPDPVRVVDPILWLLKESGLIAF